MGNNNGKKEVKSNTHFYIDRISLKRTPSTFTINFTDFTFFWGKIYNKNWGFYLTLCN